MTYMKELDFIKLIISIKEQKRVFRLYMASVLQMFFEDHIDDVKYCGHLYGLGSAYVTNGNLPAVSVGTSSISAASTVSGSGNISTSNTTSTPVDNHSSATSTLNGEATSNSVTALSTTTSS